MGPRFYRGMFGEEVLRRGLLVLGGVTAPKHPQEAQHGGNVPSCMGGGGVVVIVRKRRETKGKEKMKKV